MIMGNVKISGGTHIDQNLIHTQSNQTIQNPNQTFITTHLNKQPNNEIQDQFTYLANNPQQLRQKIEDIVDKFNKTAVIFDRSLKFQIHDKLNTPIVTVIDTVSNKVIREIPPKEILDLYAKMQDYLGLIFDKKA